MKTRSRPKGIKVKTRVRSGKLVSNHNATKAGVKVRTKIRSGIGQLRATGSTNGSSMTG